MQTCKHVLLPQPSILRKTCWSRTMILSMPFLIIHYSQLSIRNPLTATKKLQTRKSLSYADAVSSDLEPDFDSSSISCVGDSFIKPEINIEYPKTQTLRRSSRRSSASSPTVPTDGKERKQPSSKHSNQTRDDKESPVACSDDEDILDNITVAFPKTKKHRQEEKIEG